MVTVIDNFLTEVTQSSLTGVLECNASTPRSHSREKPVLDHDRGRESQT